MDLTVCSGLFRKAGIGVASIFSLVLLGYGQTVVDIHPSQAGSLVPIEQVTLDDHGTEVIQNSPVPATNSLGLGTGVIARRNVPVQLESVVVNDGGESVDLRYFNIVTDVVLRGFSEPAVTGGNGVGVLYPDGTQVKLGSTPAQKEAFRLAVRDANENRDLINYTHYDGIQNKATTMPSSGVADFDMIFGKGLEESDYVLVSERWGNTFFEITPLGADGEVISGANRLRFGYPQGNAYTVYDWNTGYTHTTYQNQQAQAFSVAKVSKFFDGTTVPLADRVVFGFRIDNDGEADVKFFGLSADPFENNVILPAGIGNRVWLDGNANGIQDSGEVGLNGVTVHLLNSDGTPYLDAFGDVTTTVTVNDGGGEAGYYAFAALPAGSFRVEFELPDGYEFSPKDADTAGLEGAVNSDADVVTGRSGEIVLDAGEINLNVDAGLVPVSCVKTPVAIGGHTITFRDVRYNFPGSGQSTWYYSVQSGNQPAISHVTFSLPCASLQLLGAGTWDGSDLDSRSAGAGQPEPSGFPADAKTDPTTGVHGLKFDQGFADNGVRHYYFTVNANFEAAKTTVAMKAGPGFTSGLVCAPSPDCEQSPVSPTPTTASVGDRVWNDANADGLQGLDEVGVDGVLVHLLDSNGDLVATTVTDAVGNYLFGSVDAGTYRVEFDAPDDMFFTAQLAGDSALDSDANPTSGRTPFFVLAPGQALLDLDAGLVPMLPSLTLVKSGILIPGAALPGPDCGIFDLLHQFNALIFGDLVAEGGDTDGRLAVAGNATIVGSYSVGTPAKGHPIPVSTGGVLDRLIVAGDLADGNWGVNGNIVVGGDRTGPERHLTNGNLLRQVSPITFDADGNVPNDGSGRSFEEIAEEVVAMSAILGALGDRGVVQKDASLPYRLDFVGEDPEVNVFNVSADEWSRTGSSFNITVPAGSTVLINIHGKSVEIANAGIHLEGVSLENVLYHYVDAESLRTENFAHLGSVIAPYADAEFVAGSIDGRAVLGGNVSTSTGFEFHNFFFTGDVCQAVPVTYAPDRMVYSFAVENTGNVAVSDVRIDDPLAPVVGNAIDLAPGASDASTFVAEMVLTSAHYDAGSLTNTATVSGFAPNGDVVSASDSHTQIFASLPSAPDPGAGFLPIGSTDPADRVGEVPRLGSSVGGVIAIPGRTANSVGVEAAESGSLTVTEEVPIIIPQSELRQRTIRPRSVLRGETLGASALSVKVGTGHFKPLRGNPRKWRVVARPLVPGRNVIRVRATGPSGKTRTTRFVIRRVARSN